MSISVFHYAKKFTPHECQALVDYALKQPATQGAVMAGAGQQVDPKMRTSEIRWLRRDDEAFLSLYAKLEAIVLDANVNAFGMSLWGFKDVQFTTYHGTNAGHYDFHRDDDPAGATPGVRRLSITVQLSDPSTYEGGQFEMSPRLSADCLSRQGDVLVFRSDVRHRVLPVTAGTRHSLVVWFFGPRYQ